jgi:hypothetical protein
MSALELEQSIRPDGALCSVVSEKDARRYSRTVLVIDTPKKALQGALQGAAQSKTTVHPHVWPGRT